MTKTPLWLLILAFVMGAASLGLIALTAAEVMDASIHILPWQRWVTVLVLFADCFAGVAFFSRNNRGVGYLFAIAVIILLPVLWLIW